jgi:hypothetical protein
LKLLIKKLSLPAVISLSLTLAACGGAVGTSVGGATTTDSVTVNGTTYTENGTTLKIDGYLNQTSTNTYKYGGPFAYLTMTDTTSGNVLYLQVLSTASGWPGVYNLVSGGADTSANMIDKSVTTGGLMLDLANGSGTGGSITIDSFGAAGELIKGSFNINLCDANTTCATSVKNYSGVHSISRTANYGSLARPATVSTPVPAGTTYSYGIHPATGRNYYAITTNATGGTLTLTLTPTVDVNMAVLTDAGFTTPATCNVTSTLNVAGTGVETCAITVTTNQKLYVTVSQTTTATNKETYTLKVAE